MRAYNQFQVELDMVIDIEDIEVENGPTRGGVLRNCELREELIARGLGLRIVEVVGPAGGNPFVMLFGSRKALTDYLVDRMGDDDGFLASLIEPYERRPAKAVVDPRGGAGQWA